MPVLGVADRQTVRALHEDRQVPDPAEVTWLAALHDVNFLPPPG
jgi:hypothetical protein